MKLNLCVCVCITSLYRLHIKLYTKVYYNCKDLICNDLKFVLGSNVKGPNNKFVERGCQRIRLTPKEKRINFTFIDGLALI